MKSRIFPSAAMVVLFLIATSPQNFGDPPEQPSPNGEMIGGAYSVRWEGVAGRTYFITTSSDLVDWDFIPEMEHGEGRFHYGFETSNSELFVRLAHTDKSTLVNGESNPEEADFDEDGLPNLYELKHGLNPFLKQTVEGVDDGLADRDQDGAIDGGELPDSHPSKVDHPALKLRVEIL